MKVSVFVIFAALIASAYAATGFAEYTIYSEKTCAEGNLLALISDVLPDVTNCVAAYCEQIGTSGQYKTTACLSSRTTPPANFIQWNFFSDNTCNTYTNYSALIPNTCVQVKDVGAAKFMPCTDGSFSQVQAATVADCNSGTNSATLPVDTSKCTDLGDGATFTKGVCAASNAPTAGNTPSSAPGSSNAPSKAPAKASSAATAALSALSVAAGFALAL